MRDWRRGGLGGPWIQDDVAAGACSEPFLFAGFARRILHVSHGGTESATVALELDRQGTGEWTSYETLEIAPGAGCSHIFPVRLEAEWIRLRAGTALPSATAYFHYSEDPASRDSLASARTVVGSWTSAHGAGCWC